MQLVFATSNKHKLREVSQLAGDHIRILGLDDIGCLEEIPETSPTIPENALQKARYLAHNYNLDGFADDTGLEIDALDGRPGVYSARYAGEEKSAEKNMDKVLEELYGKSNRKARFRTVIALVLKGKEHLFEGVIEGSILEQKRGKEGFGYDPVFQPEGFLQSFAEMNAEEKNACSHRALAVNKLVHFLNNPDRTAGS